MEPSVSLSSPPSPSSSSPTSRFSCIFDPISSPPSSPPISCDSDDDFAFSAPSSPISKESLEINSSGITLSPPVPRPSQTRAPVHFQARSCEPIVHDEAQKDQTTTRIARQREKQHLRLVARLGPAGAAAHEQKRARRKQSRAAGRAAIPALIKEMGMTRELKRARKTKISAKTFESLDVYDKDYGEVNSQMDIERDCPTFAGLVVRQGVLDAMRQAFSEHTRDGPRRKEPGRHSFHVNGIVSDHGTAAVGVAYKTHRQDWASPWATKGFRMNGITESNDAEAWAIWQALQLTLKKVNTGQKSLKPRDPCTLVIIYSDKSAVLQQIRDVSHKSGVVTKHIVDISIELRGFGVDTQLHWVPRRRGVPGNELANIVSERVREKIRRVDAKWSIGG